MIDDHHDHQSTIQKAFSFFTGLGGVSTSLVTIDPVSVAQHISIYGGAFLILVQIADWSRKKFRAWKHRRAANQNTGKRYDD